MSVDLANLAKLQFEAASGSYQKPPSLKKLAQEFESIFLTQMLTIMRESVESGGLFEESPGQDIYTSMMDQALAKALAEKGGIGLAGPLLRDLEAQQGAESSMVSVSRSADSAVPTASLEKRELVAASDRLNEMVPDFRVSSGCGWRRDPFTSQWQYHHGLDLAAPEGTDVVSVSDGRIVFSGVQEGYGNTVIVEGRNGIRVRYAHLKELTVKEGESIQKGQLLGQVGSTGRSTGPHLHLEVEGS